MEPPSPPAGLSQEEFGSWLAFVTSGRLVVAQLDQRLRSELGVSYSHHAILALIGSRPDRTFRQIDLASVAGYSEARLSSLVTQLEKKGWLRRERHPTDRRTTYVVLTEVGRRVLHDAAPLLSAGIREHFLDVVGPEQRAVLRVAGRAVLEHLPGGEQRMRHPVDPSR